MQVASNMTPQEQARYEEYKTRRLQLQAGNQQIAQERQALKDHYKLGNTRILNQTVTCSRCKAKIPAGTKNVPTKTEILGDHNHNIKITPFYFCPGGCSQ